MKLLEVKLLEVKLLEVNSKLLESDTVSPKMALGMDVCTVY